MIRYFERPLPDGWVYPCTLADLQDRMAEFPAEDTRGIYSVGLVPSTRRDDGAYARYRWGARPRISVRSYHASYVLKLTAHTKRHHVERGLAVELSFGMQLERVGSRLLCRWRPEDLRRFILEFVIAHEVGHHVYHQRRLAEGLRECPGTGVCEQEAEAYACRMLCGRRLSGGAKRDDRPGEK